jgi:hypothetical protein
LILHSEFHSELRLHAAETREEAKKVVETDLKPDQRFDVLINRTIRSPLVWYEHMRTETKTKRIQAQTIVLVVVIVILTGGFAYYYVTTSNQISSLKGAGSTVCQQATSIAVKALALINNVTLTLQSQILSDNMLIQTLNSTKPTGYVGMIATLKSQAAQDSALVAYMESLEPNTGVAASSASNPCISFNQP